MEAIIIAVTKPKDKDGKDWRELKTSLIDLSKDNEKVKMLGEGAVLFCSNADPSDLSDALKAAADSQLPYEVLFVEKMTLLSNKRK
jgi:hypothetical protein